MPDKPCEVPHGSHKEERGNEKKNSDLVSTALSDKMKKSQGNKTKMHHFLTKTRNKGHRGKKRSSRWQEGKEESEVKKKTLKE